ncbi:M48 family metalloprotease [Micromonospora peucetia]|uniref:M48 family metalloprotease n=1 Tax=Micromonospora peucetia TaxID=47871 RepID=A0A1C6W0S5_9ACTN|nr:M48 family metalloprotease [Micromonospora peucetia]WSA31781.1 M48 family metalloprotease [Micromonospora peucetia]SCL72014.1 Peptidase family M48 [Micromonospora peucetia]
MTGPGAGPGTPPDRLGWLYTLVLASLISVGISAGGLYFHADRSLARPWAVAVDVCTRVHPAEQSAARERCLAGQFGRRGAVMATGAGIALGGAVVLVLVLPLTDRRRLRRRLTLPGAQERFVELCDRNRLVGRHRPRLVVAAPPVRQAYTTGGVLGRPTVVLPAAVAVAHADPARFDPVVEHELAHVLARDVAWASAVRGLIWLPVPAVLAAGLLEVAFFGLNATYLAALGRTALIAVVAALLAAGLLRRREREADRYAADAGHTEHLVALLGTGTARPTRRSWLLARHPAPAVRAAALGRPADPPGGWTHGLAVGAVAMLAMSSAAALVGDLFLTGQATVGPPVAVCVGSVLLNLGLLPTLLRRATAGAGGWWRPVLGVATGFAGAAFIATALPVPGSSGVTARADVSVAMLVAALAGALAAAVAGLCVLLARLVVALRPGPAGWRSATYLVAVAAGVAVLWPLPALASVPTDGQAARDWLVFALPRTGWPLLALLVPVLVGLLLREGHRRPASQRDRGIVAAVLIAVLIGAGAAIWRTELFPPDTLAEANRMAQQRWLLCALTGWAVLVVLAFGRHAGVGRALTAGWLAGTAAALSQYLHALLTGRADGLGTVEAHLLAPLVWLGYLVAFTLPFLVSRPPVPGPDPSSSDRHRSAVPAVAMLAAALAVAVLGPGIPGVYAPVPAAPNGAAAPSAVPAVPPVPDATPGPARPGPGRLLTRAEARRAAGAVRAVLPRGWRVPPDRADSGSSRIDPSACRPLAMDSYLDRLGKAERVRERIRYATVPGPTATASTELVVEIRSHAAPVPVSVLAEAESSRRACPRFTARGANGSAIRFAVGAKPPPTLGEQSWRVDYRLTAGSGQTRITGQSAFVIVRAGHNLVTVYASAIEEPLDERLLGAAVEAAVAGLTG